MAASRAEILAPAACGARRARRSKPQHPRRHAARRRAWGAFGAGRLTHGMSDQPPDDRDINAPAFALPGPVVIALSIPGIAPARFWAVLRAFGPLSINGQVELANRLIGARGQYLVHRISVRDRASRQ